MPPQTTEFDGEFELTDYIRLLRRRWIWVLVPLIATLGLATGFTVLQQPSYCATAQVLIADSQAQSLLNGQSNVSAANRDLANEINIAYSDAVRNQVDDVLGNQSEVTVSGASDSDVLWFESCGTTSDAAALQANTWASTYVSIKQERASDSVSSAVEGFQVRLEELRLQRLDLRAPLDELEDRLVAADEASRPGLQASIDRLGSDLATELNLIDAQFETIASNITRLELDGELALAGTASIIQTAAAPPEPANADLTRNLLLATVVGFMLGAGAALLGETLDRSIKSADDVVGVPVLGSIPRPGRDLPEAELALATMNHRTSAVSEGYQKVRTAVEFAVLGRKITSLLVTSPEQAEGKTTTAANLAWTMSAVDHRVVLADVDFRRPRIHEVFRCQPEPGLSDNLLHQTPLNHLALRVDDDRSNMVIIPTGAQPPSPGDFVASPAFSGLLRDLEAEADLVILDSPPVLPVSDALSIARQVDAVIVAARVGKTSRQELERAVESLRAVGADVLGVCLVGVKFDSQKYGYGYNESRRPTGKLTTRNNGVRRPTRSNSGHKPAATAGSGRR